MNGVDPTVWCPDWSHPFILLPSLETTYWLHFTGTPGWEKKEKKDRNIGHSWGGSNFIIGLFPNRQVEQRSAGRYQNVFAKCAPVPTSCTSVAACEMVLVFARSLSSQFNGLYPPSWNPHRRQKHPPTSKILACFPIFHLVYPR
jgi:hypothetical protein